MNKKDLKKIGRLHPRVLIAGGAGFLGALLSQKLIDCGFEVLVLDDFSSGKKENLKDLYSHKRFKFIACDINKKFPEEIAQGPPDFIFHLARFEVRSSVSGNQLSTLLTNALGTKNLLDLAKKTRARFLLASPVIPKSRDSGVNSFSDAKRFAEALVWEYAREFNLNVRVVKLAEVYGPGADLSATGTLGRLIKELLSGSDLTIYGDGLGKAHYVYVDDAVSSLSWAMFSSGTLGKSFLVSPPEPVTDLELAYMVRKFSLPQTKIVFRSGIYESPRIDWEDFSEVEDLSEKVVTPLPEGIKRLVESLRGVKVVKVLEPHLPEADLKKSFATRTQFLRDWWASLDEPSSDATPEKGNKPKRGIASWWWKLLAIVFILSLILFSVLVPPFFIFRSKAVESFDIAKHSFTAFDLEATVENGERAVSYSQKAEACLKRFTKFSDMVGYAKWGQNEGKSLRVLGYFAKSLVYGSRAAAPLEAQLSNFSGLTVGDEQLSLAWGDLNRAHSMLLTGQAEVGTEPGVWQGFIVQSKDKFAFLELFLADPMSFESFNALHQELAEHGWELN